MVVPFWGSYFRKWNDVFRQTAENGTLNPFHLGHFVERSTVVQSHAACRTLGQWDNGTTDFGSSDSVVGI